MTPMHRHPTTQLIVAAVSCLLFVAGCQATGWWAPSTDDLPAAKRAIEDTSAEHQREGATRDKNTDPGRPAIVQADPPPLTGLLGNVNAPIAGEIFTPVNAWAGWVDPTTYVEVWAGISPATPGRGFVFVGRHTGADGVIDNDVLPTTSLVAAPAGRSPLKILRVDGDVLILGSPDGRKFRFDPSTGAFDRSES
jgi:hypothetical protein